MTIFTIGCAVCLGLLGYTVVAFLAMIVVMIALSRSERLTKWLVKLVEKIDAHVLSDDGFDDPMFKDAADYAAEEDIVI